MAKLRQISAAFLGFTAIFDGKTEWPYIGGMLRTIQPNGSGPQAEDRAESACQEKHYSVNELAALWNVSKQTIRRLFQDEADVVRIGDSQVRRCRAYVTLRIPESVVSRVYERLTKSA